MKFKNKIITVFLITIILMLISIPSLTKGESNKVEFYYENEIPKIKIKGNIGDIYTLSVRSLDNKVLYLIAQDQFIEEGYKVYKLERKLDEEKIKVVYNLNGKIEEKIFKTDFDKTEDREYRLRLLIDSNGKGKNYRRNLDYKQGDLAYPIIYNFFKENFDSKDYRFDRDGNLIYFQGNKNSSCGNWIIYVNNKERQIGLRDLKLDEYIYDIEFYYDLEEDIEEVGEKEDIEEAEEKEDIEEVDPIEDLEDEKKDNNFLEKNIEKPYINGYKDGTFKPENYGTREEVAKMVYEVLKPEFKSEEEFFHSTFKDVHEGSWSIKYIERLKELGILKGYKDGTFKPKENITRGEFVTILARVANAKGDKEDVFPDIYNHWSREYINSIANLGWVKGYGDGNFKPFNLITRAELVTILNRATEKELEFKPINKFKDISEDNWYYEEIIRATSY